MKLKYVNGNWSGALQSTECPQLAVCIWYIFAKYQFTWLKLLPRAGIWTEKGPISISGDGTPPVLLNVTRIISIFSN